MDFDPDDSGKPAPPSSIPPLPPRPELFKAAATHVPLTPMMDFFQRRLEALERDLDIEREKARSAQGLLQQQDALKAEVENQLKDLSEHVRREKSERDGEESRQHARGRIDALEKRLDEMHQSWASILKETVGGEGQAAARQEQATMRQELAALSGTMNALLERLGEWRRETQSGVQAIPELRNLAVELPADARRLEGQVVQMLGQFSIDIKEQMAAWQRRQELENEKLEGRLQNLAREKAAMQRAWEEQNHEIRAGYIKERIARETETDERSAELAKRLDAAAQEQSLLAAESQKMQEGLRRVLAVLLETPKAKDELLAAAEQEKLDLVRALKERTESMHRFGEDRREVERTMGETLVALNRSLDDERKKNLTLCSRLADLELRIASLTDTIESKQRLGQDKDAKAAALSAERDGLAQALIAEAARVREQIELRAKADEDWSRQIDGLRQRVAEEIELRARESVSVSELRAQLSTLTEHLSRALQEKDGAQNRVASWDQERAKLQAALREKEEMIVMLNTTFQSMLKKAP